MSQLIQTTDNNRDGLTVVDEAYLADLNKMAEKPIAQLDLDDNTNLLIFPQDLDYWGDKIGKEHIFEMDGNCLKTGNIMGFIGYHDTKVKIGSRFEQKGKDFFLHYMLQKVFAINLFDLKYDSDEESVFDFLIYFFPVFLKRALRQGLYKEYQTRRYNDANVRGFINVNRHIQRNTPFIGKVAYSTREYATDNHVVQLIRHTIDYISSLAYSGNILNNDDETKDAVSVINSATPTYNKHERRKVINQNLQPVRHPYFSEYRPLQRLCLQILRHEELKYGRDDEQIYGILFDGAWLWEEYLNTFLYPILSHPQNRLGRGKKYLFKYPLSGICYPDFYNQQMVIDAKYKGYADWTNIQREDLYQVITYMHVLNLSHGGFIVPCKKDKKELPNKQLNGIGGTMAVFGMQVDFASDSYLEYCSKMEMSEQNLKELIECS